MTRSEVAKAIHRSIATVRRMEGIELFPTIDDKGVHHFDEDEVAEVAEVLRERGGREPQVGSGQPEFILEIQLRAAERKAILLQTENYRLQARVSELELDLQRMKRKGAAYEKDLTGIASGALDAASSGSISSASELASRLRAMSARWSKSPYDAR